jgi:Histidine phosphatase superfamily (branch 2)
MEHMLATVKPKISMGFSTLNPLITNVNRIEYTTPDSIAVPSKRQDSFLSRATRMLKGAPADEADSDDNSGEENGGPWRPKIVNSPCRSDASAEVLSAAAATLIEGAVPVREIPNKLLSEPASMCPSEVSSQAGDMDSYTDSKRRSESFSVVDSHEEELRCIIAVIRHGDRTPKQKLKVNMKVRDRKEYQLFTHTAVRAVCSLENSLAGALHPQVLSRSHRRL